MKIILIFIIAAAVMNFGPCDNGEPAEIQKESGSSTQSVQTSFSAATLNNDFLVRVYEYQERIKISQKDKQLRQEYCQKSYLSEYGVFISMGIGSLKNPQTGQAIPQHMAERAATLDARRWASYGEIWLNNNFEPEFGQLQSFFNRQTEVVDRSVVGDSLFVFIATYMNIK